MHALPLYKMGVGFLNLFLNKSGLRAEAVGRALPNRNAVTREQPSYETLKKAFIENPFLIGGNKRLDTEIIKASSGRLISKTAAGGLCITINLEKEQALVVKILDADMTARSIATIEALKQLEWLSEEELKTSEINNLHDLKIKNLKNQLVGEIIPKLMLL